MKFYRLSGVTFYNCINTMYQFIKSFLDNNMSIFEGYGAFNANSVDPDQTPHSAASDLGLHYLPMSLFRDARHKWVLQAPVLSNHYFAFP